MEQNFTKITKEIRNLLVIQQKELSDEEALILIEDFVFNKEEFVFISSLDKGKLIQRIFNAVRKDLDILEPFQKDTSISEIMVNGKDNIFIERQGKLEKTDARFESTESLEEVIRRIAARVHREINELNPIVDARLMDGSRVNAVNKNIALNGPILTIRKFPEKQIVMEDLISNDTLPKEVAAFLKSLVISGYNVLISGGTSSGKTTFLNVLSNYIPFSERVIIIEDSAELQIKNIENIVRLECKNANVQGKGEIPMEKLIKTSLRMRPDRIIVGEIRGKEVLDMIQAMNTGHDGSLCTGHGNSVKGMLRRLESMFLQAADFPIEAIRAQIAEGIDIMIHLGRISEGHRKVLEITEICGTTNEDFLLNPLYTYTAEDGLKPTGNTLCQNKKFQIRVEPL